MHDWQPGGATPMADLRVFVYALDTSKGWVGGRRYHARGARAPGQRDSGPAGGREARDPGRRWLDRDRRERRRPGRMLKEQGGARRHDSFR